MASVYALSRALYTRTGATETVVGRPSLRQHVVSLGNACLMAQAIEAKRRNAILTRKANASPSCKQKGVCQRWAIMRGPEAYLSVHQRREVEEASSFTPPCSPDAASQTRSPGKRAWGVPARNITVNCVNIAQLVINATVSKKREISETRVRSSNKQPTIALR